MFFNYNLHLIESNNSCIFFSDASGKSHLLKSVNVRKAIELTPKARKLHRAAVKLRKSSQRLRRRFKTLKRRVSAASNYENTEEYLKKKIKQNHI